jgi:hypothetical protein
VPRGTTPISGASPMTFVVRKLSGERAMVEPKSQPPGFRCGIVVLRNWEGESMCSRTSKRVMMSVPAGSAASSVEEGRGRSSIAQLR